MIPQEWDSVRFAGTDNLTNVVVRDSHVATRRMMHPLTAHSGPAGYVIHELVDRLPVGIFAVADDISQVAINHYLAQLLGFEGTETRLMTLGELIHPDDEDRV